MISRNSGIRKVEIMESVKLGRNGQLSLPRAAVLPIEIAGMLSAAVSATFVILPLRRGWPDLYAGTIVIRTR